MASATLRQKTGLALGGLLAVAAAVSGLALASALHTREVYEDLWAEQLVQARAIYEVEAAVLELGQRMTAHLLRQGAASEGPSPEVAFETWMQRLARTELEADQRRLLPELEAAFAEYAALWPRVLAHESAAGDGAFDELMAELTAAHQAARRLCRRLRAANERDLHAALAVEREQARRLTFWIVAFSTVVVALALVVAWLFWRRTLVPLRRIASRLRREMPGDGAGSAAGELEEIEACIVRIGDEIARLRTHLSHSDRHLLETDKLATMGRLAAGVAHEIRSPLTALTLRLFALQRRIDGIDPAQADNVRLMAEEVARLDDIVSSFLELSRPPRVSPQPCSLSLLVDKTLEVLRHRTDRAELRIERAEQTGLPPVLADPPQLRQVIMNLVNNAIEAVPAGGRIRLEALRDPAETEPPLVLLCVADDGGGVAEEIRETLFDPFTSTKVAGSGLGLWIARSIATRHGGSLVLERTSAAGTVFALRIPAAREGGDGPRPGD